MPSADSQPLPPDWITKTSRKDSSKTYYYNTVTKEVSWTRPIPEDPEPETPPLPDQDLPLVQPIDGQDLVLEPEAVPVQLSETDEIEETPVPLESDVTSSAEVGTSEIATDRPLEERGVTPASPEVNDGPSLGDRSIARTGQLAGQSALSGKRRRAGANRRDKTEWRMRERRERAGAPFRGGLPSQTAHRQRAVTPPSRPTTGEVRRRDGREEVVEDRGLIKRPRVEPPLASTGGENQPQRFAAMSQNTSSDTIGRSDARDQRGGPNRSTFLIGFSTAGGPLLSLLSWTRHQDVASSMGAGLHVVDGLSLCGLDDHQQRKTLLASPCYQLSGLFRRAIRREAGRPPA